MRSLMLAAAAWAVFCGCALAQDADAVRRQALAERLMELSMGESGTLRKLSEQQTQEALGEMTGVPEDQAAWFRANVPNLVLRMVERLVPRLTDLYAETFTLEELEAQVAFYETPVGRAVANKSAQLGVDQMRLIMEGQQAYLEDLASKFCSQFECGNQASDNKPATRP